MQHKYPFVVLHLTVDPEFLDVNVHPTKMELRFRGEQELYQFLADAVRGALLGKELIPRVQLAKETKGGGGKQGDDAGKKQAAAGPVSAPVFPTRAHGPEPFEKKRKEAAKQEEPKPEIRRPREAEPTMPNQAAPAPKAEKMHPAGTPSKQPCALRETASYEKEAAAMPKAAAPEVTYTPTFFEEKLLSLPKRAQFRLIGQLFGTYWLLQAGQEFLIIDQHAAHEKVLYERTMKRLQQEAVPAQQLAPPLILTLSPLEGEAVTHNRALFERMGFSIEPFGGREYAVYSVPDHLYGVADRELLLKMIDELVVEGGRADVDLLAEQVAGASCKAAVKGASRLSEAEAEQLLSELLTLENPYTCPHGRPTVVSMSRYELEKKFKRVL